ncbi:hypothetical protein AC481_04200 [miscellaneous Crenarchaeota group archaeon SMTZ-80]|nr:MAG: hypothetical protein AC481_04200 [miscellaneous Crenarchaeota group archaeon SMTZ-80]
MLEKSVSVAVEALSWMELDRIGEREALSKVSRQLKVTDSSSLRLAQMLIFEVNRRLNLIDYLINKEILDTNSLDEVTYGVRNFLRLYVYWVIFRKSSVKEAISFLKSGRRVIGWRELRPFEFFFGGLFTVNIKNIFDNLDEIKRISLQTNHPNWYVKHIFKIFGRRKALQILEKNLDRPTNYLRLNTLKGEEEEIVKKLYSEGVRLEKIMALKFVYKILKTSRSLVRLNSYREGLFHIQDKSSCLSVLASNAKPNQIILDLCAAPGSKTSLISQIMKNKGKIYSIDISANRMRIWKREMRRLAVKIAEPIISDVSYDLPIKIKADIAIVDPPCSGTGIFIKTPSLKWRLNSEDLKKYSELQFKIIRNIGKHLKLGGILTYSTCSITLEENEMLIEKFLRVQPNFKLVDIKPNIGLPGLRGLKKCRRLYPHKHESSGFFLAKMIKNN